LYLFYEVISPGYVTSFESSCLVFTWLFYIFILYYNNFFTNIIYKICRTLHIKIPVNLNYNNINKTIYDDLELNQVSITDNIINNNNNNNIKNDKFVNLNKLNNNNNNDINDSD